MAKKQIFIFLTLVVLFFSCEYAEVKTENSQNSLPSDEMIEKIKTAENCHLEDLFIQHLLSDSIQIDSLNYYKSKGADVNIVFEKEIEYEVNRLGYRIPIIKDLMASKTKTITDLEMQNPLHKLIGKAKYKNKMDAMIWLLKNGADPNLSVLSNDLIGVTKVLLPLEKLILFALRTNEKMGVYYDPSSFFHESIRTKKEAKEYETKIGSYSMHYIDTLIQYGADPTLVNLSYAKGNIFLLEKLLQLGADPKYVDVNNFLVWGTSFQPEKKVDKILSYDLPYDSITDMYSILRLTENQLEIISQHGFDGNRPINGEFLLATSILNSRNKVKILLDLGINKVNDNNTNPYDFAIENGVENSKTLSILKAYNK